MRKFLLLFLLLLSNGLVYAQNKKVSLNLNKQPIQLLFKQIEAQCGYVFIYSNEIVPDTMSISVVADGLPVAQVLTKLLAEKQLHYQLVAERLIVIGSKKQLEPAERSALKKIFTGTLVDANGNVIPFASISLFESGQIIGGTMSDETGSFQLPHHFLPEQRYLLKISSVGYLQLEVALSAAEIAVAKRLVMSEDKQLLKTVTVTHTRPLIERKTDRYIVNVEKSAFAQGLSALEVLQKSPGIWVSQDGNIRIKGNQSVVVMINDVVQRMSSDDLAEYLKSLRSDEISKIEVIYNPPAEFEAAGSGGIIHIVLKKNRMDGLNGSVYSRYQQQGKKPLSSTGGSIAYKVKKVALGGNASYTLDQNSSMGRETVTYPDQSIFRNSTERDNDIKRAQYRIAATYEPSATQTIGLQYTGSFNQPVQAFATIIDYQKANPLQGTAQADWERKINFNSTTLNYNWKLDSIGSTFKIIGDYSANTKKEQNELNTRYNQAEQNSRLRTATPSSTAIYALQTDYTKNWRKQTEFKTGLKYTMVQRDNQSINEQYLQNEWVYDPLGSNHFIYEEQLLMFYAALEKSIGKTSIQLGLRAEETISKGNAVNTDQHFKRNYFGLFPSFYLMHLLQEDKGTSLYFNYSKRLQRPAFNDLNPYRLQVHNNMILTGNPDLLPQYTHNFQAGYNFLKYFSADIYFSYTRNLIALLANTIANNVVEYKSFNFSNGKEYGLNLSAAPTISGYWSMTNSLSLYQLSNVINNFKNSKATLSAKTIQTFTFKKLPSIDLIAEYKSPSVSGNTRMGHLFALDVMLGKKIMKERGVLRLYLSDVFNTAREKELTTYNHTVIDFYQKRQTRNISLSFTYNFKLGKKFNQQNIEQSNKEENRRMGN